MNGTPSTALATTNGTVATQQAALAIKPGQLTWDKFQDAALSQIGLKNAGNADRAVFLHQCQRTGLDPFARQIYMIERREKQDGQWVSKWTIQTGIDGYRVNRARAERDAGVRGTLGRAVFYDWDGNETKAWVRPEPPAACEITYTVRDASGETPYTSVLRFDEYVQTRKETIDGVERRVPSGQWATKPAHMLEKCTEADVYRKAFPQDFSGVHLDDAMPLPDPDAPPAQPPRQRVTAEQARQRAPQQPRHQASQVNGGTGEVIDAEIVDEAPWPEGAGHVTAPAAGQETQAGHAPADGDPRGDVLASLDRLRVAVPADQLAMIGRLTGKQVTTVDALTRVQAQWLADRIAGITTLDELEAAAVASETARASNGE